MLIRSSFLFLTIKERLSLLLLNQFHLEYTPIVLMGSLFNQLRRHKISIFISSFVISTIYLDYNQTQKEKQQKK
jgi:hypothetical protein